MAFLSFGRAQRLFSWKPWTSLLSIGSRTVDSPWQTSQPVRKQEIRSKCRRPAPIQAIAGTYIYCGYMCVLALTQTSRMVHSWSPQIASLSGHACRTRYRDQIRFYQSTRNEEFASSSSKINNVDNLAEAIGESYKEGETDGILDLARTIHFENYNPHELITASLHAVKNNKGQAAGIINGWIGACCEVEDRGLGGRLAWKLLEAYDELGEPIDLYPDGVTLALVYSALCRVREGNPNNKLGLLADSVLDRAAKLSQKMGGSKRRKGLAASRRRLRQGSEVQCQDIEETMQQIYGPDFHVLQETQDFVVLSKPSGMVCYHKHSTTAGKITSSRIQRLSKRNAGENNNNRNDEKDRARIADVSLEDALLHQNIPLSTLNPDGRGLVHRIDRGTSGCIILAKTDDMHAKLVTEFFLRRANKSYTAVVSPPLGIDMAPEGIIDLAVNGRPAKSMYRVLKEGESNHYFSNVTVGSLLRLETFTGRKHQVRIHCAQGLKHPILLDPLYGKDADIAGYPSSIADLAKDGKQRFFLHASSLCIPKYGIEVEAPLPSWWKNAVNSNG